MDDNFYEMKNRIARLLLLTIAHFVTAIIAGAAGWEFQMIVVSIAGIISVYLTWRLVSPRLVVSLTVIAPFYLLYIPSSIYAASYFTYPIWIFGLLICLFTWLLIRLQANVLWSIPLLIILVVIGGFIVWPNTFTYLDTKKDPQRFSLDGVQLVDVNEEPVDQQRWRGKVLLLDIWHSACRPCIEKFPELQELHDRYRNDNMVKIVSLNFPLLKDANKRPTRFTDPYSFEKMYFLNEKEHRKFSNEEVPLVLILDKKGVCRYAGSLNTGWNIFIGNARTIIRQLKKEP